MNLCIIDDYVNVVKDTAPFSAEHKANMDRIWEELSKIVKSKGIKFITVDSVPNDLS